MERKISYHDYMQMKPGDVQVFEFDTVKAAYAARAVAYVTPQAHPRDDVKRYSCAIDENARTLTVRAIGYDEQGD